MDRVNQLRGEAGGSRDSSLDSTSSPGDSFLTANESSRYFSISDSSFDISPIKDVSLSSTAHDLDKTITGSDELLSDMSSITKKSDMSSYKIGEHIEAANILSGGVDIFDDNENSYENDLVIDDNVGMDMEDDPNSQINKLKDQIKQLEKVNDPEMDSTLTEGDGIMSLESGVLLQIDGDNIDAVDIGNGLYLYRTEGDQLAALQIVENEHNETEFKFLKVRPNFEGNLEVYEEFEIEVPSDAPRKEEKSYQLASKKQLSPTPSGSQDKETTKRSDDSSSHISKVEQDTSKLDGCKGIKFNESRKSPLTFHPTPTKEGILLTKSMVDKHLDPNRHAENKKTIEVKSDNSKQKLVDKNTKHDQTDSSKDYILLKTGTEDDINTASKTDSSLGHDVKSNTENVVDVPKPDVIFPTIDVKQVIIDKEEQTKPSQEKQINASETKTTLIINFDKPLDNKTNKKDTEKNQTKLKFEENHDVTKANVTDDVVAPAVIIAKHDLDVTKDKPFKTENITTNSDSELKAKDKLDEQPTGASSKDANVNNTEINSIEFNKNQTQVVKNIEKESSLLCSHELPDDKTKKSYEIDYQHNEAESTCVAAKDLLVSENYSENQELSAVSTNEKQLIKSEKSIKLSEHKDVSDVKANETTNESFSKSIEAPIAVQRLHCDQVDSTDKIKPINLKEKCDEELKEKTIKVNDLEAKEVCKDSSENLTTVPSISLHCPQVKTTSEIEEKIPSQAKITKPIEDKLIAKVCPSKSELTIISDKNQKVESIKTPNVIDIIDNPKKKDDKLVAKTQKAMEKPLNITKNMDNENLEASIILQDVLPNPLGNLQKAENKQNKEIASVFDSIKSNQAKTNSTQIYTINPVKPVIGTHDVVKEKPNIISAFKNISQIKPLSPVVQDKNADSIKTSEMQQEPSNASCDLINLDDLGVARQKKIVMQNIPHFIQPEKPFQVSNTHKNIFSIGKAQSDIKNTKILTSTATSMKPDFKMIHGSNVAQTKPLLDNNFINECVSKASLIKNSNPPLKVDSKILLTTEPKSSAFHPVANQNVVSTIKPIDKKDNTSSVSKDGKSVNNNNPVPFGKWTEANKQAYLNKIKESKVPTNSANANQIKQPNDLNRRDVLKKIDSQRQTSMNNAISRPAVKTETVVTKVTSKPEIKMSVKTESSVIRTSSDNLKPDTKPESENIPAATSTCTTPPVEKADTKPCDAISYQSLIDKTIEDILMDRKAPSKNLDNEWNQQGMKNLENEWKGLGKDSTPKSRQLSSTPCTSSTLEKTDNNLEMKLSELHGIPFVERSGYELPQKSNCDFKVYSKPDNRSKHATLTMTSNMPSSSQTITTLKNTKPTREYDSDEEIIEHVPVTGDIEINKRLYKPISFQQRSHVLPYASTSQNIGHSRNDQGISEKDFEKFARSNSITYENSIPVNIDDKKCKNVTQSAMENPSSNIYSVNIPRNEALNTLIHKPVPNQRKFVPNKLIMGTDKYMPLRPGDMYNRNPQNKVQIAYNSALTARRQKESPITVIEDKPVKVVYMDNPVEFVPSKLNAQGKELSPAKKVTELDTVTINSVDSVVSETVGSTDKSKTPDAKKYKHQRKQVLTPVDSPLLEVIEPNRDESPKKKRKIEETANVLLEKSPKSLVHKKSYLLGRMAPVEECQKAHETTIVENLAKTENSTALAIDSLVKAAELLDNQSNISNDTNNQSTDIIGAQNSTIKIDTPTSIKRGRGRPRKYPLPDGSVENAKTPSPAKKQRAEPVRSRKRETSSEDSSTDDEFILENWTMGKINENIVCPICNKLFRSENVVFKHVKHCTGPSPNRSESDNSSRKCRDSQDIESSQDSRDSMFDKEKETDSESKNTNKSNKTNISPKSTRNKDEDTAVPKDAPAKVILIEDTPIKEKIIKEPKRSNPQIRRPTIKSRPFHHVCEICGKVFRQPSYLISHKLQHKNDPPKKTTLTNTNNTVFSCEICNKEFRKLHHLVQHRIIHNPSTSAPSRLRRKSSVEQTNKSDLTKQTDDQSVGFRCESCDKSFRKLHHLVEHRETHDGINRQKNMSQVTEKNELPLECDICKKSFRKLHHLVEHKEQHAKPNKSEDKNVRNSLSTKDIIHECSLCYMVFPNEHSLNKHTVICLRKKKQSESKQNISEPENQEENQDKQAESAGVEIITDNISKIAKQSDEIVHVPKNMDEKSNKKPEKDIEPDNVNTSIENVKKSSVKQIEESNELILQSRKPSVDKLSSSDIDSQSVKDKPSLITINKPKIIKTKRSLSEDKHKDSINKSSEDIPAKVKKSDSEDSKKQDTPKTKNIKPKNNATVVKKQKTVDTSLPNIIETKPVSSDEEDIRYMLNPDFSQDTPKKIFMKKRAMTRNSLQIERPKENIDKRRISLQHHPKAKPALQHHPKAKPALQHHPKAKPAASLPKSKVEVDTLPSTDSDDSDIKYSFPEKTLVENVEIKSQLPKQVGKKRQSLSDKRKSLGGIAKRKLIGKGIVSKQNEKALLLKQAIKRRTADVEHRCDCGQLFNSAALLARHTSLAHTPPRIRRRRSAQPDQRQPINIEITAKAKTVEGGQQNDEAEKKNDKNKSNETIKRKRSIEMKRKHDLKTETMTMKTEQAIDVKKAKIEQALESRKTKDKHFAGVKKPDIPPLADITKTKMRSGPVVKTKTQSTLDTKKQIEVIRKPKTEAFMAKKIPKSLPTLVTLKAKRLSSQNKISKDDTVVKRTETTESKKVKENILAIKSIPTRRSVGRPPKAQNTAQPLKQKDVVKPKIDIKINTVDKIKPKRTPKLPAKVVEVGKVRNKRTSAVVTANEKRKTIDDKTKK